MPPRKQKQPQLSNTAPELPPPSSMALTTMTTPPPASPVKQATGITQAQKQAMIDNFQIEVTERARSLRATYAQNAQFIRGKLESRLNRIPQALRKKKMGDLFDEHAEKARPKPAAPVIVAEERRPMVVSSPALKTLKRTSDHFVLDDKENQPTTSLVQPNEPLDPLPQPKKRAKPTPAATANTKATRAISRQKPSVLSPRSHNSRNLPKSPFKPYTSPEKFYPSAPLAAARSPMRPMLAVSAAPVSRAPSRQAKRVVTAVEVEVLGEGRGRESETSTSSAETTIVTKAAVGRKVVGVKKVGGAGTKSTVSAAAKRKEVATAPVVGTGRTLRKRG